VRERFEAVLESLVVGLTALLALVVIAGFLFRKLGAPLVWYDELAPILLAWLTYYGSCLAALRRAHIGFPKLVASAPPVLREALGWVREICVVGFFAIAAWAGWKVLGVLGGVHLVSLEWMPARLTQSVIPVSAAVFIVAELIAFAEARRAVRAEVSE